MKTWRRLGTWFRRHFSLMWTSWPNTGLAPIACQRWVTVTFTSILNNDPFISSDESSQRYDIIMNMSHFGATFFFTQPFDALLSQHPSWVTTIASMQLKPASLRRFGFNICQQRLQIGEKLQVLLTLQNWGVNTKGRGTLFCHKRLLNILLMLTMPLNIVHST